MDYLDEWINCLTWFDGTDLDRVLDRMHEDPHVVPNSTDLLAAYSYVRPQDVRVVVLGTHPYRSPDHAHGVAFSVPPTVTDYPPALLDIYTELELDWGTSPDTGCLIDWARQGVLLLNNTLSRPDDSMAHADIGWETLIDETLKYVVKNTRNTMFLFWGNDITHKRIYVSRNHHAITSTGPGSTGVGFFGSRPFSRTNEYLSKHGRGTIDWSLT